MQASFDLQRDHVELIRGVGRLLTDDGTLLFSNNRRGFRLAEDRLSDFAIEDITTRTIPEDYQRFSPHCVFLLRRGAAQR